MDIILYNPLSAKGKSIKVAQKLAQKMTKTSDVMVVDLLTIDDIKLFLKPLKSEDRLIIIGGDGTLHRIVNQVYHYDIIPDVYMYKAGTGNDFLRSLKKRGKLIHIKPYLKNLPTLHTNGKSIKVLNGAGVGLDGLVVYKVNKHKEEKNKSNYFKNAVSAFFEFKPGPATITVDGKTWTEDKLWFASCMYAPYFGGGMKIAPKKTRDQQEIELVIVKKIPKWLLLLIFPTIYLGWHRIFKSFVRFYRGKHIKIELVIPSYLQVDGEHEYPVLTYEMKL